MSVESEANAVGDYWEGHPEPPPVPPTQQELAEYSQQMAAWENKFGPGGPPPEPVPPAVPGPPSPGAGMPAARLTDLCAHGGVITGPGCPTVLIGGLPAARAMPAMDMAACPMFNGPVPHATGTILKGSTTVLIGNMPAARVSDPIGPPSVCAGNAIAMGCMTVLIGDAGGSGGGGGGGGSGGATAAEEEEEEEVLQMDSEESETPAEAIAPALIEAATVGVALIPGEPLQPAAEEPKHTFAVQVVIDSTGEPVPGVGLNITLPDREEESHTTDREGRVAFDDLETAGTCSIKCELTAARLRNTFDFVAVGAAPTGQAAQDAPPPAQRRRGSTGGQIAEIEERKVKTGDSIARLADEIGMTWQELAKFNWNTDNPREINRCLHTQVGCTKRTESGDNYRFSDTDDPGIVYLPRAWSVDGLATDAEHVIRVRAIRYGPTKVRIRLFDRSDTPMPRAQYLLKIGGETYEGQADGAGWVEVEVDGRHMPEQCHIDWGERGESGAFPFSLDVYLETQGANRDEAMRRRLHNLGYPKTDTLEENLTLFRTKYGLKTTGRGENVDERILNEHDEQFENCGELFTDLCEQRQAAATESDSSTDTSTS
jgi:uncharacterized Zn-binding protein involved in type VI secretion